MAHPEFYISREYFIPVTCFLTINVFAVFGNLCPSQRRAFVSKFVARQTISKQNIYNINFYNTILLFNIIIIFFIFSFF